MDSGVHRLTKPMLPGIEKEILLINPGIGAVHKPTHVAAVTGGGFFHPGIHRESIHLNLF